MSDSKTIKLYRVTGATPVEVGSFDYTKDNLAQNLRFTVEGDLVIVTVWPAGTPEPKAAIVYQDPNPLGPGSLNLVHNGTTAIRTVYIDDVAVTDLAVVRAYWPLPAPWSARPTIERYPRTQRAFYTTSGTTTMNVRGYIPDDALELGAPCVSQSGRHRPECTAQAQAIRKLNQMMVGGFVPSVPRPPYDVVQWEVGPDGTNLGCVGNPNVSEETLDDCEPLAANSFRGRYHDSERRTKLGPRLSPR